MTQVTTKLAAGTKFSIASGAPATSDAAGYAALEWKQAKKVNSISEKGKQREREEDQYLEDIAPTVSKGVERHDDVTVDLNFSKGDEGQALAQEAADSDDEYHFRYEYSNGDVEYHTGPVLGMRRKSMTAQDKLGFVLTHACNPITKADGSQTTSIYVEAV